MRVATRDECLLVVEVLNAHVSIVVFIMPCAPYKLGLRYRILQTYISPLLRWYDRVHRPKVAELSQQLVDVLGISLGHLMIS